MFARSLELTDLPCVPTAAPSAELIDNGGVVFLDGALYVFGLRYDDLPCDVRRIGHLPVRRCVVELFSEAALSGLSADEIDPFFRQRRIPCAAWNAIGVVADKKTFFGGDELHRYVLFLQRIDPAVPKRCEPGFL